MSDLRVSFAFKNIIFVPYFLWSIYENQMKICFYFSIYRKPAMFEGLEIDQYIWSVLQNKQTVEFDEVTVDQNAKVKPCLQTIIKVRNL